MRGKHKEGLIFVSRDRITPADAGKTERKNYYELLSEDHPRGCGENNIY